MHTEEYAWHRVRVSHLTQKSKSSMSSKHVQYSASKTALWWLYVSGKHWFDITGSGVYLIPQCEIHDGDPGWSHHWTLWKNTFLFLRYPSTWRFPRLRKLHDKYCMNFLVESGCRVIVGLDWRRHGLDIFWQQNSLFGVGEIRQFKMPFTLLCYLYNLSQKHGIQW